MANDKLRNLTPIDVTYVPGERPTNEKLEGAEVQTKTAIEYIENTIGDAFGESLQTNPVFISNISRDIGDRSALNPVLLPSVNINSYVQSLVQGKLEHELDLIPVGSGAGIILSSADTSVIPSQYKASVSLLEVPGDWTILGGLTENGVTKNSRKLVTHAPSSGGTVTFATVTSGRGSAYEGARHNTIPSLAQIEQGGPFLTVLLSDAINNIYTIQLPVEVYTKDRVYDNTSSSLSNTATGVGSGQQLKLPSWMFDVSGLDMSADASGGGPKSFPLNSIRIYDWAEKKVVDGLLEVKASSTPANRQTEIVCRFRSDVILDTVSGQYVLVTSGISLSEMVGALSRDLYFHKHLGDDMIRGIKHSDLYGLRTSTTVTSNRSDYYGPSSISNNDHSMYLHRAGYVASDIGAGGNVMRGHLVIGSTDTGPASDHENFNLLADSYSVSFGKTTNGGKIYFDKIRTQNLEEGRGNIPQNFSDTALVIEGSLDDITSSKNTVYVDGLLRVSRDVVLGTDSTHDVFISGDVYIKNSMILIPRDTSGLTPEEGMVIYSSTEKALIFHNGVSWVNPNSLGFAAVVGDGVISFGKYNGTSVTAIQDAITDASTQGGGKVKILRGNYNYGSSTVTIPSNIIIEGEGGATSISGTGTIFEFDTGSSHSGLFNLKITGASLAISVDGEEHNIDNLDIHSCTTGIELKVASDRVHLGSAIRYASVSNKINILTVNPNIVSPLVQSVGYSQRAIVPNLVNKASDLDRWVKISGTGAMSYVHDTNCLAGKGHFEITGTGLFVFEDYIPVMPFAGIGGYLGAYSSATATVTIGFQAYDANLALLTPNGGFLKNSASLTGSWEYIQDICVLEAPSGVNKFPVGTRFIKPSIQVLTNTGTVYFDAFNIFPMTFSTISLYS